MTTDIFVDAQARATIERWVARFVARIPRPSESRRVRTRLGETLVRIGGPPDAPPVLLLHGALASSAHVLLEGWPLLETHRVYAIDLAGHSPDAPPVRPAPSGPGYADFLVDALDQLALPRAHVVGVSWGGFVATKLAAVAPERVDHLALVVPAGLARGSVWTGLRRVALPMWRYRRAPDEQRLRAFIEPQLTTWDDDWAHYLGDAVRCFRLDLRPPPLAHASQLARFTGPTLVFGADRDVHFPGPATIARARRVFPNLVEAEVLIDCGHAPPMTDDFRRTLCARLAAFLDRPAESFRAACVLT
jgi:pimeloyl-ACP methyl ester carboxylesterase